MKREYLPKQLDFLRTGYASMPIAALTTAFNAQFDLAKKRSAIASALKNYNITCGRKGSDRIMPCGFYSPEKLKFLRNNYPGRTLDELTVAFNAHFGVDRTRQQIKTAVHNRGIVCGRTGRFEKGQQSWNKGVKGYMGPNVTSFKKGHKPANWEPLGTERIDAKDGYIQTKVAERDPYTGFPTRYKLKHVYLWEQMHGPVPKGHAVVFRDGKKLNCVPDNLMLVTRAELLRLNKYQYASQLPEIKPSVLALAKLEVKTFRLMKKDNATC